MPKPRKGNRHYRICTYLLDGGLRANALDFSRGPRPWLHPAAATRLKKFRAQPIFTKRGLRRFEMGLMMTFCPKVVTP